MKKFMHLRSLIFIALFIFFNACKKYNKDSAVVQVREENGKFVLYKNNKPYFIKGAAGYQRMAKIKEMGGNSIRVWTTVNADSILDEAHKYGLSVILGLDILSERHGFDYDNNDSVKAQFNRIKKDVLKYKNHPALLMWGVGNELDIYNAKAQASNMKVWSAVEDIAKMIHEVDPNHPTTTMIVPFRKTIYNVKSKCPSIDVLSINTFGALESLPDKLREPIWGWNGAYIISEWGPQGWWEVDKTLWEAPIEQTSTLKAQLYKERYTKCIEKDKEKCIGSYVFYWGQKQEKTSTWFSLFTKAGSETEAVQVMNQFWTGKMPVNKAPQISELKLKGKYDKDNIFINSGEVCDAFVLFSDPENDSLVVKWELYNDLFENKGGGDKEMEPVEIQDRIISVKDNKVVFKSPLKEGPYRLFVYVIDPGNKVATANIPFYVIEK